MLLPDRVGLPALGRPGRSDSITGNVTSGLNTLAPVYQALSCRYRGERTLAGTPLQDASRNGRNVCEEWRSRGGAGPLLSEDPEVGMDHSPGACSLSCYKVPSEP